MILKFGAKGADVVGIQQSLTRLGYPLNVDGDFGESTENAILAFQRKQGIVADGIVGDKTLQAMNGQDTSKYLKDSDYQAAAKRLEVPELSIRAFGAVESNGQGFFVNGKPKILFERHRMYTYLKQKFSADFADQQMKNYPNVVNTQPGGYQGGTAEYVRLEIAKQIDLECAYQSTSWGQFQIMGENWQVLGYQSVDDFVNQQYTSESLQLEAFVRFIEIKTGVIAGKKVVLLDALKEKNWDVVFTLYNGANYKKLGYQAKFQTQWDHLEPIYGEKTAA